MDRTFIMRGFKALGKSCSGFLLLFGCIYVLALIARIAVKVWSLGWRGV